MSAIQGQVIPIRKYRRVVLKDVRDNNYRRCGPKGETIQHIVAQASRMKGGTTQYREYRTPPAEKNDLSSGK